MDAAYPEQLTIEQDHPSLQLNEETLTELVHHILEAEEGSLVHLSVVLSDHSTVRHLNETYLEHDYNTDVLSFSLQESPADSPSTVEGEVYVDLDTANERHEEFDTTFEREGLRYIAHGVLHLLGYEDKTESGQQAMRNRENQYLEAVLSSPSGS